MRVKTRDTMQAQMEHLIATWIVQIWQNRRLGEHAPCWDPGGDHSPNTPFAASLAQGGFWMEIPAAELYYELLPAHYVAVHARRGVKIRGLWYDGPALDAYRDQPSTRGGRYKGRWVIRRDPRDARTVFFQDPLTHAWHTLRWTGLPPEAEVPSFGDARVRELLRACKQAGLQPRSDRELPLLLELIRARTPIDHWPTLMTKAQRTEHAREVAQGEAAALDRPSALPAPPSFGSQGKVVPLRWEERARQTEEAIDTERRRRREEAVLQRPAPPPLLGEAFRRHSLFLLRGRRCGGTSWRTGRGAVMAQDCDPRENGFWVPFVLPGPVTERETAEGWKRWRLTRQSFVPAPRLDVASYRAMSPRRRMLHNLHRAATHANLPFQETPMSAAVARLMRSRIQNNALKHSRQPAPD